MAWKKRESLSTVHRGDEEETKGDTGEMIEWRFMTQEEMEQCWKKLVEKMEEEVLHKYKVDDSLGMEACTKKQEVQNTKVERRLLGKNFRFVQRLQAAACEKHARRFDRRRGDEGVAKNEDYEGQVEEN